MKKLLTSLLLLAAGAAHGQAADSVTKAPAMAKKWFESFTIRGYVQARYNRLLETNPALQCEQCDKSWGANGGFSLRRIRVIFFGQLNERIYFYLQPDFASTLSGNTTLNVGLLRDAYMDLGLDKASRFRVRVGQSKVPYGFENMQSSQNRLALDRNDALNSALSNERDLGAFIYWAPTAVRQRFSKLVKDGLKGSGDYGVVGLGVFNGQTANRPELNDQRHIVARLAYPLSIGSQIIEPSVQAYTGHYVVGKDQLSTGVKHRPDLSYPDQRLAATFVLYPQPFGVQAEYNVGRGPEFNPATDSIENQQLHGGYVLLNMRLHYQQQQFYPFVRVQYYDGGKKHERDARSYTVREAELGVEWQPSPSFELVTMYTLSSRRFEDFQRPDNRQRAACFACRPSSTFRSLLVVSRRLFFYFGTLIIRGSLRMLTKYKLVWMGLLAISYGVVKLWLLASYSDGVLAPLRQLEPQTAAALRQLPAGTPVLVEGRISRITPQRYGTLVAYVRSSAERYSKEQEPIWLENDWVAPALLLEVGSQTVPVEAGYALRNTTIQKLTKRNSYNGFDRGSQVFAVGTVSRAGTIKAETVYGGKRDDYLFKQTGEKWVGYAGALFVLVLGLGLIGVEVVLGRNRR
ncbi:porin [Hymenobacter cellulosivorans]|uniref:OprO/OprP family phosphate-selective porin n=1 Tax=Hymenobacter cellulosivorans TaxID=2932249 RepID=A0ABY4FFC7_9BACT|nr:porin [Hymenobacter cellulosivorans]UOQ55245.1 OprO/OprP family phosphate-selective porin [Hymenobacter cellulosivorans]